MPISFNQIPANLRVPGFYAEIDNSRAFTGLNRFRTRLLLLGQKLTAGTAAAGVPVLVSSDRDAQNLFGVGSNLSHIIEVVRRNSRFLEVWALPFDDLNAGVQATGTYTIAGTATESATLSLYVGGRLVQVLVTSGMTANQVAAAINTAINANSTLPATSTVSSAVVTVTARHKGEIGNEIVLTLNAQNERTPAGITVTPAGMSGGSGNPDITTGFANLPDEIWDYWVTPYTDTANLGRLKTELDSRWGPMRMLEGHVFGARLDTLSNLSTFGNTLNNEHLTIIGVDGSRNPGYEWAAALATQVGVAATADPSRPYHALTLYGIIAPPVEKRFTKSERNILLFDGISTFDIHQDGTVETERIITTYQTSAIGVPEVSSLDAETMFTLAYLRQDARAFVTNTYIRPRLKLANDGTRSTLNQSVITPSEVTAGLIGRASLWEQAGLIEDLEQFKADLVVERDPGDVNRLNALLPPNLTNQLRIVAAKIQYLL